MCLNERYNEMSLIDKKKNLFLNTSVKSIMSQTNIYWCMTPILTNLCVCGFIIKEGTEVLNPVKLRILITRIIIRSVTSPMFPLVICQGVELHIKFYFFSC